MTSTGRARGYEYPCGAVVSFLVDTGVTSPSELAEGAARKGANAIKHVALRKQGFPLVIGLKVSFADILYSLAMLTFHLSETVWGWFL